MASVLRDKIVIAPFPAAKVETCLRAELEQLARGEATARGIALPNGASIGGASIALDSLGVVDTLCAIEPMVGFELKESIVRSGGYDSINEAVADLMPRINRAWDRRKSGKSK